MSDEEEDVGVGLCDAVLLAPLTEDTFVHNLHVRFKKDIIYTYVGAALVCVNPSRPLPLYSPELARAYLSRPPYQLPPHLYAITATAYRWVRDRNESQCIIITGESGAGKTEAARVCLQCAVLAGGGAGGGGAGARGGGGAARGAGGALVAAGTLLEAFGNAATIRNHNASRFGKLLDIEFDFKGDPVGGYITHYLLEKERVCRISEGERNFHVFYQLLAGADAQLLKRLKLQRSWGCYRILEAGPAPTPAPPAPPSPPAPPRCPRSPRSPHAPAQRAAEHDTTHFNHTREAMNSLGISLGGVARILAFILKLGNAEFQPQHNIDGTIGAHLHHHYEVWEACNLVGVDAVALLQALGAASPDLELPPHTPEIDLASPGDNALETEGSAGWARGWRDRLLCATYARLFTWLVAAANGRLQAAVAGERTACLGILDTYGFESLKHNGLERLLINYCAERVQAVVTGATLRREQEEYQREGIPWRQLSYTDHQLTADLLDLGGDSVLGALGAATARGEDAHLLALLQRRRHARLRVLPPTHFTITHFAGPVVYNAVGMCRDNRDELPPRLVAVMRAAADPILAALFPVVCTARGSAAGLGGLGGSPRRPAALASRQRALLAGLARRVAGGAGGAPGDAGGGGAAPRLVRCLRADRAARPRRLDTDLLAAQIRDQGIMDMALLRRAGWCESMCARVLLRRYSLLRAGGGGGGGGGGAGGARAREGGAGGDDPVRAARLLLRELPIPSAEFAYGRTKIFIRSPRTVWELEALRHRRIEQLTVAVQRAWRRRRRRRRDRAQRVIARAYREHRRRRRAGNPPRSLYTGSRAGGVSAETAAGRIGRAWRTWARRRYLRSLWARLPPRRASPLCAAWPPCPHPALLRHTDRLLQLIHHRYRCHKYRAMFDQTARNRMREKVTCSALFRGRKAQYARSVPHPFVGDYVRLRASAAWRRHAPDHDRYVVFAELVGKVSAWSGRVSRCVCVVSTCSLLLLEPRALRARRRVPAHLVYRLTLSPHRDDLLAVHVRACPELTGSTEEVSQCSSRDAVDAPGCLFGSGGGGRARRGDLVVRSCHVLELATKLYLVVQNAVGHPPTVHIADQFEANFGQQLVTISVHGSNTAPAHAQAGCEPDVRLVRRGSRLDVLL